MKRKSALIVAILIMAIGFASISTTLIINGNAKVSENTDDFDIYFSKARLDTIDVYESVISLDKKTITFNTNNLSKVGDKSTLTYEVTNNSSNYDAEVKVTCTPENNKYTSIKNELEGNATIVKAKESINGNLTITLNKTSLEEVEEEYTCKLEFNAVERNVLASKYLLTKGSDNTSKYAEIGDTISVENENFFVISNINHEVIALAYYNLNVGEYLATGTTGLQNKEAKGFYGGGTSPYLGSVSFSSKNGWLEDSLVDLRNTDGVIKDALYDKEKGYETYLKNHNFNSNVRLIYKEELENLGCSIIDYSCKNSKYSWIYSSSYWTGSSNSNDTIWNVSSGMRFSVNSFNNNDGFGVRPVVEFSENV